MLQVDALHTVVAVDALNLDATRALRARLFSAKPMEVGAVAQNSAARRVLKAELRDALLMVVVGVAKTKGVLVLPGGNLVYALDMEVARGVNRRAVLKVLKVILACASPMEAVAGANFQNARRVHKGALCFAKRMVGANDALIPCATKELKGAHPSVRDTEEGNAAHSQVVVQRVSMGELNSVLPMVVGRGVCFLIAQRVQGDEQVIVFVMGVESDASQKGVERVLKEVLISARLMAEGSDAVGANQDQSMEPVVRLVIDLQGERRECVLHTEMHTELSSRTHVFMVQPHWYIIWCQWPNLRR